MFEDKVLKHKRAEGYYRRNAALGNVDGAWKNFVESNKVQEPWTMAQAPLANELEPGALKDEMLKDFDPSQETHEEYLQRKNLERPFNMAEGGQLVAPTVDGSRPGFGGLPDGITKTSSGKYKINSRRSGEFLNVVIEDLDVAKATLKKFQTDNPIKKRTTQTSTISGDKLKVLNKYAQDEHGVNYKNLDSTDKVKKIYDTASNRNFEYRTSGQSSFPEKNKNKIIEFAKKKNIELNFDDYPKYGVAKDIGTKRNPNYTSLINFKNRGFKDFTKDLLNEADRIKVMDNFELPKGVKNWNFDTNKFGLSYEGNENLLARISNKLKDKKKYKVAADFSTPEGWMVHSMNRLYNNETTLLEDGTRVLKKGIDKLTYEPIKNKKGIIVGFKDNTTAGDGKKYYSIKKYKEEFGDGAEWKGHRDFKRIDKFLKIAKGAQVDDPSKLLQKILDDKGLNIKGLTLNDVLSHERYFDKLSTTAPKKLIERQIVLHHKKGVGGNIANAAATKDIQLLSGAINQKVKGLESFAKKRKLTVDEIADLKNYGAKIVDFDGKTVGGGYTDPTKQFAAIEKDALKYAKGDKFNVKTVTSYLERLGCGEAAGGRIMFGEGTSCAKKGEKKLNKLLFKGGGTEVERGLVQRIISGGGKFALSMLNPRELIRLSNLVGPAAVGLMAAYEAGSITDDVLRLNKPLDEALAGNWLTKSFLPYSEEFAKQKNLLQSGNLTGSQKEYAREMMKMEEFMKEGQRIEGLEANKLVEGTLDDDYIFTSQEDMNKAYQGLFERFSRIKPYAYEEGITGRSLENEAAMNEYLDSRLAKTGEYTSAVSEDKFRLPGQRQIKRDENYEFASSPIFGGHQRLVNKAPRPKNIGRGGKGAAGKMPLDFSIPGYTPYNKAFTPSNDEILNYYKQEGIRHPRFGTLEPGEGTGVRMNLATQGGNRSIFGSKFADGGLAGLMKKYYD